MGIKMMRPGHTTICALECGAKNSFLGDSIYSISCFLAIHVRGELMV